MPEMAWKNAEGGNEGIAAGSIEKGGMTEQAARAKRVSSPARSPAERAISGMVGASRERSLFKAVSGVASVQSALASDHGDRFPELRSRDSRS